LLLCSLAALVYHVEEILEVIIMNPGHPFTWISILHNPALLDALKNLVTTDPTPGVLVKATGIPPHIQQAVMLSKVLKELTHLTSAFELHKEEVVKAVDDAIENKALESGQVTGTRLRAMLDDFQKENLQDLEELKEQLAAHAGSSRRTNEKYDRDRQGNGRGEETYQYVYNERFYQVPKDFQFPQPKLREGLQFWLKGQSVSQNGRSRVRPFRKLTPKNLPSRNLRDTFNMKWKPIFSYLEKGAGLDLPRDTSRMTGDEVEAAYNKCIEYLKKTVSYCWRKKGGDPLNYTIGTWLHYAGS
jgi:hypothetical protein